VDLLDLLLHFTENRAGSSENTSIRVMIPTNTEASAQKTFSRTEAGSIKNLASRSENSPKDEEHSHQQADNKMGLVQLVFGFEVSLF
jgi:hypothetical protein